MVRSDRLPTKRSAGENKNTSTRIIVSQGNVEVVSESRTMNEEMATTGTGEAGNKVCKVATEGTAETIIADEKERMMTEEMVDRGVISKVEQRSRPNDPEGMSMAVVDSDIKKAEKKRRKIPEVLPAPPPAGTGASSSGKFGAEEAKVRAKSAGLKTPAEDAHGAFPEVSVGPPPVDPRSSRVPKARPDAASRGDKGPGIGAGGKVRHREGRRVPELGVPGNNGLLASPDERAMQEQGKETQSNSTGDSMQRRTKDIPNVAMQQDSGLVLNEQINTVAGVGFRINENNHDALEEQQSDLAGAFVVPMAAHQVVLPATVVSNQNQHLTFRERIQELVQTAPLVEGVAIQERTSSSNQGKEKRSDGFRRTLLRHCKAISVVLLVVVVGGIVSVVLAQRNKLAQRNDSVTVTPTMAPLPTQVPLAIPSIAPTLTPTTAPTSVRFQNIKRIVGSLSKEEDLHNSQSPQFKALGWLADLDSMQLSILNEEAIIRRYALVVLYEATNGELWLNNSGWLSDVDQCSWYGVNCYCKQYGYYCNSEQGDDLAYLSLGDNNLGGTLPDELGVFSNLQILDMNFNNIGGTFPVSVGNLTRLRGLHLKENQLTGTIPDIFDKLNNLEQLYVAMNQLTGTLPLSLSGHPNIEDIVVYTNFLHGTWDLRNIPSLSYLSLWTNFLSGSIPSTIGNLTGATLLLLGDNIMTGTIPSILGTLPRLEVLALVDMALKGTIPPEIFQIETLVGVGLGGNELSGTIPSTVGYPSKNLRGLSFEKNNLTGTIPPSIGNLQNLEALSVHSNHLTGTIPTELGDCIHLRALEMGNNTLSGRVPESLKNLDRLDWLNLARNDLTGNMNFMCGVSVQLIFADCKGDHAEIDCLSPSCCSICCSDKDTSGCNTFLSTATLMKQYLSNGQTWP